MDSVEVFKDDSNGYTDEYETVSCMILGQNFLFLFMNIYPRKSFRSLHSLRNTFKQGYLTTDRYRTKVMKLF